MALATSEIFHRIPPFKHSPLDHTQPSIRIMRVLPNLSPEGFVQCALTHGSTADKYTCLSYTWGDESTACPIFIDGQLFFVRQNLHNFLRVVREKYPLRLFWIDAVCIDQSSIAERNHQVAQMGAIYTAAVHVIIWLGKSSNIAEFFRAWNQSCRANRGFSSQTFQSLLWQMSAWRQLKDFKTGWLELANHAYWTRAWITQEIAHSRALSLLADMVEIHELHRIADSSYSFVATADVRFSIHINIAQHRGSILGKSLFSLLTKLPNQECQRARDRVYSLLGLAAEGSNIRVDYGSSDMAFVLMLLDVCKELRCLCGFTFVSHMLGGMETLTARASEKLQFATLMIKAHSMYIIPQGGLESSSILQQADSSLLHGSGAVLSFRLHRVCDLLNRDHSLEVRTFAGQEMKLPIGRFTLLLSADYHPRCKGTRLCKSQDCACQQDYTWWPGPDTHEERQEHHTYGIRGWHPDSEDAHHEELRWYKQPGSKRMVSNWFQVELQTEYAERTECYTLGIPLAACWWYAHQLRDFRRVDAQSASDISTIFVDHLFDGKRVRLCEEVLSGRSAFNIERKTTPEEAWLHEDADGFK